jgi:hypothetical protein
MMTKAFPAIIGWVDKNGDYTCIVLESTSAESSAEMFKELLEKTTGEWQKVNLMVIPLESSYEAMNRAELADNVANIMYKLEDGSYDNPDMFDIKAGDLIPY